MEFAVGDEALVTWAGGLYEARVSKARDERYHVHYKGWSSHFDEWVTADRMERVTPEGILRVQDSAKAMAAAEAAARRGKRVASGVGGGGSAASAVGGAMQLVVPPLGVGADGATSVAGRKRRIDAAREMVRARLGRIRSHRSAHAGRRDARLCALALPRRRATPASNR